MTTTLNGQTTTVASAAHDVADELAAKGVKYAAISFVDMHGKPKCKMVPLGHLGPCCTWLGNVHRRRARRRAAGGERRRGRAASRPRPSDRHAVQPRSRLVPRAICGSATPLSTPAVAQILKRVTAEAAALGYTFNLGIETEFFLLTDSDKPAPASPDDNLDKPCYDVRTMLHNYPGRRRDRRRR